MQYKQGAKIISADGHTVGTIDRIVLNPETLDVTHLVAHKGTFSTHHRVVPIEAVANGDEDSISLSLNKETVKNLPELEEKAYMPAHEVSNDNIVRVGTRYPDSIIAPGFYWYPNPSYPTMPTPVLGDEGEVAVTTHRNIPDDTVALKKGARVLDSAGEHLGNIEQVLTDSVTEKVSDFVVTHGVLLKERKRIPVTWVDVVADEQIHLNVTAAGVKALPAYDVVTE